MSRIEVFPFHGFGLFVVLADVAHEFSLEVRHGTEDAASNDIALDLSKPQFDLVEPRRIGWSVVQMNPWVLSEKFGHLVSLVCREIVSDDVNRALCRLAGQDIGEKPDKLRRGVALGSLADDISSLSGKRRIQRQRSVALVLKAMALSATRRQRQHRADVQSSCLEMSSSRRSVWRC